ncbi:hypothetical protein [Confluentibacter flavum]|uniref:Uncharacterized protein n=1 Tax=Confluentibacter flavum TaxID=1909700 RepID=A0A2N3HL20_9FLAO|nr:hypothetical protein [Confluentibacter flavum]PKQ45646.1 hypothetical protein CSW08_06140 [Confluentibacter flavum]
MKTSLVIISALLILSVFVPFAIFIYNGAKNTMSVKKQSQLLIKNNGIIYGAKEIWRKNFIGISTDKTILTYMHFKEDKPLIRNISLRDIKQCNIIGNYKNSTNKAVALKNLDLELVYYSSQPNTLINFFNIDNDLSEDFELQRIENWHAHIKNAIVEPQQVRIAS